MVKLLSTKLRGMAQPDDPDFCFCSKGCSLDIVLQVQECSSTGCKGIAPWHGQLFHCDLCLQPGTWTAYGITFESFSSGIGFLVQGPDTSVFRKPSFSIDCLRTLRETCCGMGGFSIGASYLGFRTAVFNDRSDLACQAIRLNGGTVVPGVWSCKCIRLMLESQAC